MTQISDVLKKERNSLLFHITEDLLNHLPQIVAMLLKTECLAILLKSLFLC